MAKFCSNCGKEVQENQDVCLNCGVTIRKFNNTNNIPGAKSKIAAGLLGIFLGSFGVHNFYLGFTSKAVIQLLLGIFCLGIGSGIWGLIEGILILTGSISEDAAGNPLKE